MRWTEGPPRLRVPTQSNPFGIRASQKQAVRGILCVVAVPSKPSIQVFYEGHQKKICTRDV